METLEEKIGYLISKAEEQGKDLENLSLKLDRLEATVEAKLKTMETIIAVVKFTGLAALSIATLKFGDVSRLWDHFFN